MKLKDSSLTGPLVDRWNSNIDDTEKIKQKLEDLINAVRRLQIRVKELTVAPVNVVEREPETNPSVVHAIKVDLGAEYNTYLTSIYTVYSSSKTEGNYPIFFYDGENKQQLLQWHEFEDFYKEYLLTVIEDVDHRNR